jgi:hypothetical protein
LAPLKLGHNFLVLSPGASYFGSDKDPTRDPLELISDLRLYPRGTCKIGGLLPTHTIVGGAAPTLARKLCFNQSLSMKDICIITVTVVTLVALTPDYEALTNQGHVSFSVYRPRNLLQ